MDILDSMSVPLKPNLNIPPWLFCVSWCPDFAFRGGGNLHSMIKKLEKEEAKHMNAMARERAKEERDITRRMEPSARVLSF